MRILYVHPNAWTGEYAILRKLRELGHDVCVLEEKRGLHSGKRHLAPDFRAPGDGVRTLWFDPGRGAEKILTWPLDRVFRRAFDGRNLVHRMWVVAEAARLFAPDAIICSDGFSYAIPAAFLKRLGLLEPRLIVSYIGGDILDSPEAEYGRRRKPLVNWLIRSSIRGVDVMRAVSPLIERALRCEGAAPSHIAICPSHLVEETAALDALAARKAELRREVRSARGLSASAPLIVTLGMNQKGKGLHVLARAWPSVIAAVPQARWLLCGPDHPWLHTAVWPVLRDAGIAHTVLATGALAGAAVFEHLAAADLHVNPSLCESLNMATVEAAAVATPSITSDGAGIADWIQRYECGKVVPAGESGALADAIIFAFQNTAELARWSAQSRSMTSEFALDRVAARMVDLARGGAPSARTAHTKANA